MAYPRFLDKARSIVERATLNTTATVYRLSQVADTTGGFTDTYTALGSVSCSFSSYPITPIEREGTNTVQAISVWTFVFPYGTDIQQTDRIVCQGRTFEVTSSAQGSIATSTRVLATEIV